MWYTSISLQSTTFRRDSIDLKAMVIRCHQVHNRLPLLGLARGVGAVAWAPTAGKLFTAGSSKQLVELATLNGDVVSAFDAGRYPLTALGVSPDAQCACIASAAVAVWQPLQQRRLLKFSGHAVRSSIGERKHEDL